MMDANINKNKGGSMFDYHSEWKFSNFYHDFNETEIKFIVNAINARTKLHSVDMPDTKNLNIKWLYHFLLKIEPEHCNIGYMMNIILRGKLKDYLNPKK